MNYILMPAVIVLVLLMTSCNRDSELVDGIEIFETQQIYPKWHEIDPKFAPVTDYEMEICVACEQDSRHTDLVFESHSVGVGSKQYEVRGPNRLYMGMTKVANRNIRGRLNYDILVTGATFKDSGSYLITAYLIQSHDSEHSVAMKLRYVVNRKELILNILENRKDRIYATELKFMLMECGETLRMRMSEKDALERSDLNVERKIEGS